MTEAKIILLNFIVIVKIILYLSFNREFEQVLLGISSCKSLFNSNNLDLSERLTKFLRTAQLRLPAVFKAKLLFPIICF